MANITNLCRLSPIELSNFVPFRAKRTTKLPVLPPMRDLDDQDRLIIRQLIRDPRESDNGIGETTGVNVRTVGRKRQRLEQDGILSYHTQVNLTESGTGQFTARHVYIIKFRLGVTV